MSRDVTKQIVELVVHVDHRLKPADLDSLASMIDSWDFVFNGRVWPLEGKLAVRNHYEKKNAFPIAPGDIVSFCREQRPWSSVEHARWWVKDMENYPHNNAIFFYTGLMPDEDDYASWVREHADEIVTCLMQYEGRPPR